METSEHIDNKLYGTASVDMVIKKYEELFRFLKRKLGRKFVNNTFGIDENDSIVGIKRGLVEGSNKIFWDYLCATHAIMENEIRDGNLKGKFDMHDGLGCTKLIFSSGKEVVFARETEKKCPKGVVSLDKFFYALAEVGGVPGFTRINNELTYMETAHFRSKSYLERKEKIMKSTKEEIIATLNITDAD